MKYCLLFILGFVFASSTNAQNLLGSWETITSSNEGSQVRHVLILTDAYQVHTQYDAETGKFMATNGGSWSIDGQTVTEIVEFDTHDARRVGSEVSFDIYFNGDKMGIVGDDLLWTRIDDGGPGALQGAWLMSGRYRNGEFSTRDTSRPRKTMKILSGTRFQWIAYNTETKQFMGTGGGTYTTVDGKYTEQIEFFSRDDTRVGASLEFDYSLNEEAWHHEGFSSKGDPMHEIWSVREN